MVSRNNVQLKDRYATKQVPHYGIRKLSVGVASVLLSTTLYMGVTAHADTIAETDPQPTIDQPAGTTTGNATGNVQLKSTSDQPASTTTNSPASGTNTSSKPVQTVSPEQPADTTAVQPASDQVESAAANSPASENGANTQSASAVFPKQPANVVDTQPAAEVGVQPFVNLAVASDNNELAPKRETVNSQWIIHYVNQADHKQELKDPTVITLQYTRTNTPQSDGTTKYGDWSYVPGSFKQTGTPITVNDGDNPVKQDNIDKDGENMDVFTIIAMYPTISGYTMHNNINGTRLHDDLVNDNRQADTMSKDFYAEYDVSKERSVAVKFVDDQSFDPGSSDGKKQVGQAITLTGHDGDTVNLNLTVPDKYQLADGQQLPTTYTFAKGSGDVTIRLAHKVVQREATVDVQIGFMTLVDVDDESAPGIVVTQNHWKQLGDEIKDSKDFNSDKVFPSVEVGTLTGHVGYDLVDNQVVSFNDDWTSLNLGGQTYQMPDGTEVVNGMFIDSASSWGKTLKEQLLKYNPDTDPDYVNQAWHGYLSANKTNEMAPDFTRNELQAGLVGNEPNKLAKVIGDQAATAVKIDNKTIDSNWLKGNFDTSEFSEQNGRLQASAAFEVVGVYVPYVEKIATRMINVTTPDGKTTTVKQTATLAKQIDFGEDVHPEWTTSEWSSYDVPTIQGYTVSQFSVAKETVTGTTEDQTVNITYTANPQTSTVVYQTEDGTPVHTTTVNGKTGQTVTVPNEVPAGWHIVNGEVPSEITFGPNGTPQTVVTIAHSHATVTPDAPKTTGDKLPDNPDKAYPAGVGETDLNKTVTRTIKITTPDGQTKTFAQTVKLTRTADVDEVTGEVTYSKWTTGNWSNYDVLTVPGYTASQNEVPATEVTSDMTDQTINISYTANSQTIHINYVDSAGKTVRTTVVTGKTGETVGLNLTVPDKYQLADGQQLPTTYTFTAGSGDVTIRLAHKVVQREATVDVQIGFMTLVDVDDESAPGIVVTQNHWKQLGDEIKDSKDFNSDKVFPSVEVGTLTGHVGYDLVDNQVVSFNDDWTSLNLGGQTYQMPNGTEVVNGILVDSVLSWGKKLKEQLLKYYPDADPDYATRPWHGYLSVNKSHIDSDLLVGNEPNALAKATGDRAATAIEMPNKPIDLSSLQGVMGGGLSDFNEQDGQLRAKAIAPVYGMYIPYVEKTATRTINVTTPDGKTTMVKQTATLAKRVTAQEDVHPDWTTGEWAYYNVPTIPGYTASQSQVAKETVTGTTTDQTVNVTYTPDAQKLSVKFVDDTTGQVLKTVVKTGVTNANAGYNTQSDIRSYEGQYYVLVSDSSNGANLVFDNNDSTDQAYEVYLKHGTHQIDEHHTITQTVHYTATDHAGVPDDHIVSVQFDRDGYHDEVTGTDHWNNWKQGDTQTFAEVPTPKKAGYTPDKSSVPATVVHPSDHNQTIDVTYSPDTQKVIVTFIDDTDNGKTLKTVTKTGPTNSNVGYTTGDDINTYKGQHYVLVSDQTHGQNITFDTDTNTDQRYEVHLKHGMHQINDQRTITETVHYKMADGSTAPVDHTAKIEFSRDGFNDEVTATDHWNAWTPSATQQFDAVQSPVVKGYTPDVDQIPVVTVNPDSQNIDRTVAYTPDVQKLDVTFIDDTAGTTLKTIVKNGVTNADAKYNTKSDIQNFESQHYVLVSDSSKGAALVFDNDDAVDQHYVVHLKHNTHAISEHHTVNETVHYKMSDGTKAPADYHAKALSFSRDGFNDEVTGIDHWNAWTPNAEQTFDKVASPLVAGYTPGSDQINAQTVEPTDHDLEFTVTYAPNVQIAHVKYIDDTDHKVLTQDDLNGRTGETSGYHTADRITEFKRQHYVFVSDNYPAEGMTFDNHDRIDQTYEVHFKHATRTDEQDVQVSRMIKYFYQDGRPAQPDHTDALKFHETKVVDLVDGHTVSDDWTPAQDFKTIETPAIQGYTPDHTSISNIGIVHDHPAIVETVTYNPDAQKAVVKYIDDTIGKQLEAKDLTGVSDQSTGYTTKSTIDGYVAKHYDLASDGTHGKTITFDHDDSADQSYEVHLKHGTEPANESRIKKITVHYQYADGLARSGKAADDKAATNLTFKRTGTHDLVTDKIAWNAWDHADQTFSAIDSPVIQGYTPDRTVVDNIKVNPDSQDLTEVAVIYHADSQKLSVDFIDDTTGKTLKTVNKIGYSDESTDYNTKADIQDFISKHYDLTSDQTNGENLVFDHDDNTDQHYEVHLSHHTHRINEHHTVTETVHYRYADGLARSGKSADDFNAKALKFSRDGFNDEVTGIDHWNAWTPADRQTFAAVQSPVIEGYTSDQSEIGAINVVPTSQSIEKTVTYTADAQKLTVNFIDDVTGQMLKTVAKTGYSDESVGYNTKADIQNFVGQHYDLVSDTTKGTDLVFDHNDGVDQVYDVHLTHHLTPISDHQVVNETIHYVYADGLARTGKAANDHVAMPFEFNRTGKHDDVTGTDAWDAWTPGNANFAAVQSPLIQGYTPDQSQIDVIPVDANSQDVVKTVTYSADSQTVTVDFIDDTDHGKVLKTVTKTGGSDEAVGYNTKSDIQTFVDGHYKLDHDTSNGNNLVFDHDDAVDQYYEVHLTHVTAPITESTSTAQVIHYQLADGTLVATDYTAKVDFSRDGFKDLVTNADHWNAWTPNATYTFDAVKSPAKAGYTPDHAQVDAVTVEPHHANLETTVTYSPDAQKAAVKYIDDITGKTLQTKELTGVSDETSTYTTASAIKQYVGQHYKLVSDQTNGKPVAFDHDDGNDQTFEVHLTHTYQQVSQEHQVHETIHYRYADGKQARPDYTAKAIAFSRTGTQDLVTENIQWNAWTPDQVFAAVDTPAVNGYTPDVQTVAPVKVGHDSHDVEQTVVYHADDQTILVNYIDDDTHSTLKTDSIIGKTAQTSDYTTKKSLDKYKGQHYDVVSDDTNGGTLKFDSDSTKVQTYNVHLKHNHQAASDKATVRQTVHYVYQDGKQAAKDHVAAPIEFTRTGDTDLVTGKTTWNAWTPATRTFTAVVSPSIEGYTPSRVMIEHVNVHPGDKDLDTTVTYVPDRQVIVVNYIDQTTGKTLKTDTLNGHSDQTSGYTTKSQIDSYVGQHYKLISDDTHGRTLTFDHDDQATQTYDVVLGHETEAAHRTHEVHETVDYVYADGSQAAKSFTAQPLAFSQTGVHDLVTNTTDWNGDWTQPQEFAAVKSPTITGFTASTPEVKAVKVNHESSDVHELVIYDANAQTAQIKYIDDVTGKTLETDGANGHFNESIVFSHIVNDQINKFKQAHYKLVSNNFAGQKYQADNDKNVYEVHLTHERQNVHATDAVTETVKFQYADGSQAQPTKTQTVNFGRDGIKDLVTGTTAWMPVDPQTIGAVDVSAINGYTADTDQVPAVKVNFGDKDITKVVTYTANDQNAGIKIIDDTTGKVLNTQSATGKFGTEIQFQQDPAQQVIDLQAQHYELVSDNFKQQTYQADNAKNQFEIHVKHQMMDAQRTDKVTETVRYQDNHGNMLHPVTTQTKTFTEHGITDQVTGKTVWTPAKSQTMDAVSVPEITGYTPDKHSVPAAIVNFGDKDINEVIVYTPVSETANIKYIDDTTGKTLLSDQVTGDFGTQIKFDHDPLTQINQYEGQGYKLVSNSYDKTAHQFSATPSENQFEVHFKHGTMPVVDTDTVTETIHYLGPDGNKLAPDKTQTITFTRHGIKDQVTGQIDWNSVEPQEFNAVKSPVINGYQADVAVVEGYQVLFGDQDVVVNVHYTKLPEQQPGKQPGTDMVNTGKVTPEKVVTVAKGTVQNTKQDAIKNSVQSTMQDTKQLPQTGNDKQAGLLSLIGSSLMASLAIFGLSKKKKHEN